MPPWQSSVRPLSQEAYDYIAKLNNGTIQYNDLDESIRGQIIKSGNTYTLKTNEDGAYFTPSYVARSIVEGA